jgi:hypothetical protein
VVDVQFAEGLLRDLLSHLPAISASIAFDEFLKRKNAIAVFVEVLEDFLQFLSFLIHRHVVVDVADHSCSEFRLYFEVS